MKLESFADFCRDLPHVSEDVKWGNNLVFMVDGKMFCVFSMEKSGLARVSFKVEDHRFLEMTDRPQFIPAPYMARARWVTTVDGAELAAAELRDLIRTSHRLYFEKLSKTRQRELGGIPG